MPSGKTHDATTYLMLLPVFLASYFWLKLGMTPSLLLAAGTWFGGLVLSPDLDTKSRSFYRWGIFRCIWWPYQWLVPHRSALSHGILLGAAFRLAYLSAVLILLYGGARILLANLSSWEQPRQEVLAFLATHQQTLIWLGIGVWLGSLLHIVLDKSLTALFRR